MHRMDDLLMAVGQIVRTERVARNLTVKQLSNLSGVSLRFLQYVEMGRVNISITRLAAIARALDVPLATLFSQEKVEKVSPQSNVTTTNRLPQPEKPHRL